MIRTARRGLVLLALSSQTACTGDVGVRAVITLPAGLWDSRRPFDHIRIEAKAGNKLEVACLFPLDTVNSSGLVVAAVPDSKDPYACADRGPAVIDADLTDKSWGLQSGGSRAVNFVWPDSKKLSLRASAGFGGKLDVLTATAEVDAGTSFPDVELALGSPIAAFFDVPSCPIFLTEVSRRFNCITQVDCLAQSPQTAPGTHTAGMFGVVGLDTDDTDRPGCRTFNNAENCVNKIYNPLVAHTGPFDVPDIEVPAFALLRGRFARCAGNGDKTQNCPITTDCVPPKTALLVGVRATMVMQAMFTPQPFMCMPPTAGFVEFRVGIKPVRNALNMGVLDMKAPSDSKACFFDLLDFDYDLGGKPSKPKP
jgi:hypothetical protein